MDLPALTDRLYAEAVAADLRDPAAFTAVRTRSSSSTTAGWVQARSLEHQGDLKLTAVDADLAFEDAYRRLATAGLDETQPVHHRISRFGQALLEFDGRELILRVDEQEPGREILRWRFITLLMPAGILAAGVAARCGRALSPSRIRLLHPSMAPDGPVVQQHLHQSASVTFERLWASVRVRTVLEPSKLQRSLRSKRAFCPGMHTGHCPRCMDPAGEARPLDKLVKAKHMDIWLGQLHRAFIASDLLKSHALHRDRIEDCEHCKVQWKRMNDLLPAGRGSTPIRAYPLPRKARDLAVEMRKARAERRMCRAGTRAGPDFLDRLVDRESATLTAAFRRLGKPGSDPRYEALLLQYLRIKTATYRMLVHAPGRHGLKKFLHHFSQIEAYQPSKTSVGVSAAQSPELDLRSTEYRVSPEDWLSSIQAADRTSRPRTGQSEPAAPNQDAVLIHFQRSEPKGSRPLYDANRRKLDDLARRIGNVLQQDPRRLIDLRGVDICGVEEHQPLWVSAQTLSKLREISSAVSGRTSSRGLESRTQHNAPRALRIKIEPLRVTMHTGEDFSWLTTGVRTVAEPFRWGVIRRGDRIGHGLAVTLNPEDWWKRRENDVVEISDFDRLQDLGFLGSFTRSADSVATTLKRHRCPKETLGSTLRSSDQERWLQDETEAVLARLSAAPLTGQDAISIAIDLWTAIGGPILRRLQSTRSPLSADAPPHLKLLHRYLWRRGFRQQADLPRNVRVVRENAHELGLLVEARGMLVRHLARWQIPIESNPSSNLVVGSLDAVASQEFLARSSQEARDRGLETLAWTISTDDPITFATSLADEYAYAWAGMVLRADNPYDPAHARALLEEAAATSMRTRFAARPA